MSNVIPFPARQRMPLDPLDALAGRVAHIVAELPCADDEAATLKLLRSIDRKLGRLVKALETLR